MKGLYSMLALGITLLATSLTSNAATLTRENVPGDPLYSLGTSTASVCTYTTCTALTNMTYGSPLSKFGDANYFVITFDASLYPGTPVTFDLGPSEIAAINASSGNFVSFSINCDVLEIKQISPGNYVYRVYFVCQ
ncbi:hypothetical protein D3C71_159750 [compost metagenome]